MESETQNPSNVDRLDDKGNLRPKPFKDAGAAFLFAKSLEDDDQQHRAPDRLQIMAMLNGEPPWPESHLSDNDTNVNFSEGEETIERLSRPYIEYINQEEHQIEVKLSIPQVDRIKRRELESIISCAASEVYRDWPGMHHNVSGIVHDMVTFGYGVAAWRSPEDPRFRRIIPWRCFFPAKTTIDLTEAESVVIKEDYSMKDIYAHYSDKGDSMGWKMENLKKILIGMHHRGTQAGTYEESKWEDVEESCRNNGMSQMMDGKKVAVYQIAICDPKTGKIDMFSVADTSGLSMGGNGSNGDPKGKTTPGIYLREVEGMFEKMTDFVQILPLNTHNTSVHGIRGHGHKVEPVANLSSRVKSRMVDHFDDATTRWWAIPSAEAETSLSINQKGRNAIIPESVAPAEVPINAQMGEFANFDSFLSGEVARGNGGIQDGGSRRVSATKERINEMDRSSLTAVEFGNFHRYFDPIINNFVTRLIKGRKLTREHGSELIEAFRKKMETLGIIEEIYKDSFDKATQARAVGPGSKFDERQVSGELLQVMPFLSNEGRHRVMRLFFKARVGACLIEDYVKPFDEMDQVGIENWRIQQEDNDLVEGRGHIVLPQDAHDVHVRSHLQSFNGTLEVLKQLSVQVAEDEIMPQDLQSVRAHVDALMPHLDQHMAVMEQQPFMKDQFNALRVNVEEIRRTQSEIRSMMEDAEQRVFALSQKAQQSNQGPQPDPEQQQRLQHKEEEHQQNMAHEEQRRQADMAERKAAFDMDLARKRLEFENRQANEVS